MAGYHFYVVAGQCFLINGKKINENGKNFWNIQCNGHFFP